MPEIDPPEPEPGDGDSPDSSNPTNPTENRGFLSQPARKSTVAKLRRFIHAYTETGCVDQSCEVVGIARDTHYHKLKTDAAYQRAFEEAQEQVGQMLEDLAVQRVRNGNRRLVLYQGEPVTVNGELLYEVEYDTHLHHVLLKRFRRELYKERVEQQISGEITIVERIGAARKRVLEMNRSAQNPDANDLAG
jgi:hypothetical protein